MIEANEKKMHWDWEHRMRTICMARRPDLILEDTEKKMIYLIDKACLIEVNKNEKGNVKI